MIDYCDMCDNLVEFCECNSIDKIHIIDLEATSNKLKNAKVLEISIYSIELPDLTYKEVFHSIVKREDLDEAAKKRWLLRHDNLDINDLKNGKSLEYLSNKLTKILDNGAVTSFNVDFDLRLLNKELFNDKKISYLRLPDIMERASKFCKIPATTKQSQYSTFKRNYRNIKLEYAYQFITGEKIGQISHRASEDAKIAAEIVIGLIKKGKYDLSILNHGKYNDLHLEK